MARDLVVLSASVERPDERFTPAADRVGPHITIKVLSRDLKHQPVHSVPLTEQQALSLAASLLRAVLNLGAPAQDDSWCPVCRPDRPDARVRYRCDKHRLA